MESCQKNKTEGQRAGGVSFVPEGSPDTTAVRLGYEFDKGHLAQWLNDNIAEFAGPLTVRQFCGGQSNPTYLLETPRMRYVLRRKPPGPLLPGAHAIEREARVLTCLRSAGFPVARMYALCVDDAVIGTWFYVMEMVEGRIFWDATLPSVPRSERAAYYDSMNSTLAELHTLNPESIGLHDYRRAGNYFERQIRRWSRQYLQDEAAGRDANLDRLIDWLRANIPDDEGDAFIHGDYRIDNVIFHPTDPRVVAVLDWELSTMGHPLADFAYHAMMYRMPAHIVAGLAGRDPASLGIPTEADYSAAYCRRTGRAGIPHYDFYLAFNFFRLAAILHGIKGRVLRGNAVSADAAKRMDNYSILADIGWSIVRKAC
jgi:aminoglycoside phosphotransferase (APT) family kinase protein